MSSPVRWLTAFLDRPEPAAAAAEAFWTTVTGTTVSPRRGDRGQFATLLPAAGDPFLRTQTVCADNGGGHLDVHSPPGGGTVVRAELPLDR